MTQYLTGKPFSAPVSKGNMTSEEYFIRVGAIKYCPVCKKNKAENHKHEKVRQPNS